MRLLYEIAVWLHILAATIWVGGIAFLVLVVVPWLRGADRNLAATMLSAAGRRFRNIGWVCFAVFAVTGSFSLWMRGVRLTSFVQPEWLSSPFGTAVIAKLVLFTLIVIVSVVHDFLIGPQATTAMMEDPRAQRTQILRRRASLLGRFNALLAVVILFAAVVLVRGVP